MDLTGRLFPNAMDCHWKKAAWPNSRSDTEFYMQWLSVNHEDPSVLTEHESQATDEIQVLQVLSFSHSS